MNNPDLPGIENAKEAYIVPSYRDHERKVTREYYTPDFFDTYEEWRLNCKQSHVMDRYSNNKLVHALVDVLIAAVDWVDRIKKVVRKR